MHLIILHMCWKAEKKKKKEDALLPMLQASKMYIYKHVSKAN